MGINFIPIKTEQALFDLKVSWDFASGINQIWILSR
jgi:hypothetical protein